MCESIHPKKKASICYCCCTALLVSPSLILFQDRHFAEVKALQVRLEEQQERNNTLAQVNSTLREQLNLSESTNERLVNIFAIDAFCIDDFFIIWLLNYYRK